MATEVQTVTIPFNGDTLVAAEKDGHQYISIRQACGEIGLAYGAQFKKLKDAHWATVSIIETVTQDGGHREVAMIDVESVGMWLAGVNTKKVKPEVRAKIERYQKDVKQVVADFFLGRQPAQPAAVTTDPVLAMLESMTAIRREQLAQKEAVEAQGREIEYIKSEVKLRNGLYTIVGYVNLVRNHDRTFRLQSPASRAKLAAYCNRMKHDTEHWINHPEAYLGERARRLGNQMGMASQKHEVGGAYYGMVNFHRVEVLRELFTTIYGLNDRPAGTRQLQFNECQTSQP